MSLSFLEGLDEALEQLDEGAAQIVPAPPCGAIDLSKGVTEDMTQIDAARARLQGLEDELFHESLSIVHDALKFADIDPGDEEPPEQWVEELGYEAATKRFRLARMACLSAKEAPVGIKMAQAMATGIIRARAADKGSSHTLNIAVVHLTEQQMPHFPSMEIDT
jgi:hypothetical protein